MSIKFYCDVCKDEIVSTDRVRRILGKVMIEIMVRHENTWNAGHVCDACILEVVNKGRPAKENDSYLTDRVEGRANA